MLDLIDGFIFYSIIMYVCRL